MVSNLSLKYDSTKNFSDPMLVCVEGDELDGGIAKVIQIESYPDYEKWILKGVSTFSPSGKGMFKEDELFHINLPAIDNRKRMIEEGESGRGFVYVGAKIYDRCMLMLLYSLNLAYNLTVAEFSPIAN